MADGLPRCVLSEKGRRASPRTPPLRVGTVTAESRDGRSLLVHWDGNKGADDIHRSFIDILPAGGAVPPPPPTRVELARARMMVEWAARHVPNGPGAGSMNGALGAAVQDDIVMAVALIARRLRAEFEHG